VTLVIGSVGAPKVNPEPNKAVPNNEGLDISIS